MLVSRFISPNGTVFVWCLLCSCLVTVTQFRIFQEQGGDTTTDQTNDSTASGNLQVLQARNGPIAILAL